MLPFMGVWLQDFSLANVQNPWPRYLAVNTNNPWIHPYLIHSDLKIVHPSLSALRNPHNHELEVRNHEVVQVSIPLDVVRSQIASDCPDHKSGCQLKNDTQEESSSFNARRKKVIKSNKRRTSTPQNKSRNILPSMIHKVISYISKKNRSQTICNQIFNYLTGLPAGSNVSSYYNFMRQIKSRQNHYVNRKALSVLCDVQESLIDLYSKTQQQFYLKVARIMARHFLDVICPRLMSNSKRISKQKRLEHLGTRRDLLSLLFDLKL